MSNTTHYPLSDEDRQLLLEVMQNVRMQQYSPERLCELQKIIDTQHYYWWMNDLKSEESSKNIFPKRFEAHYSGIGTFKMSTRSWTRNAKYTNSFMSTTHMGHNPMVWFMDERNARGIFLFESHMSYPDEPNETVEMFFVYCNDFVKADDGQWYIEKYRLINIKQVGAQRDGCIMPPDDYKLEDWD